MLSVEQKAERVARAERHAESDRLVSGDYIRMNGDWKGCSVGCDFVEIQLGKGLDINTINANGGDFHSVVAEHDGTPEWLEHLRDKIFEGLPAEDRAWWHVSLAKSLPVGVDLGPAYHLICIRILNDLLSQKESWPESCRGQVADSINQTIAFHQEPTETARSAAWSAAESAWSAADSAAWSAANKRIALHIIEVFESMEKKNG
mgnify:FL=1